MGAAFIFDFLHSTLTFLKFSPVMAKYFFPNSSSKFYYLFVYIFLQILSYDLYVHTKFLYRSFVFEYICTSTFFMMFFACIILY